MKKTIVAFALALISATSFAGNRQAVVNLPSSTPVITLTQSGKTQQVHLTKAKLEEVDESHVRCTVYAGSDKASVRLPISFDNLLECAKKAADCAYAIGILPGDVLEQFNAYYDSVMPKSDL